ncbi:4084_t:CDS:2, partial [Racocetra fulgida]
KLDKKIIAILTDNGANIKAAIEKFDNIVNIPCASHTLQLSINHGLKTIEVTIKQCKELIAHLSSNKKWNSIYFALEQLILLERPIRWLENTLSNSARYERKNYCTLSLVTLAIEILIQNLKNVTSNDDDNIVQTMQKLLLKNLEEYQFNKLKESIADSHKENNLNSAQLSQSQQSQSLIAELFSELIIQQQDTNICN